MSVRRYAILMLACVVLCGQLCAAADYVYLRMDGKDVTSTRLSLSVGTSYAFEARGSAGVDKVRMYVKGEGNLKEGLTASITFTPSQSKTYELDVIGYRGAVWVASQKFFLAATPPRGATAPATCVEDWVCGGWSTCMSNQQTRSCADASKCGTKRSMPELVKGCSSVQGKADACGSYDQNDFLSYCNHLKCTKGSDIFSLDGTSNLKIAFTGTTDKAALQQGMTELDVVAAFDASGPRLTLLYGDMVESQEVDTVFHTLSDQFPNEPCSAFLAARTRLGLCKCIQRPAALSLLQSPATTAPQTVTPSSLATPSGSIQILSLSQLQNPPTIRILPQGAVQLPAPPLITFAPAVRAVPASTSQPQAPAQPPPSQPAPPSSPPSQPATSQPSQPSPTSVIDAVQQAGQRTLAALSMARLLDSIQVGNLVIVFVPIYDDDSYTKPSFRTFKAAAEAQSGELLARLTSECLAKTRREYMTEAYMDVLQQNYDTSSTSPQAVKHFVTRFWASGTSKLKIAVGVGSPASIRETSSELVRMDDGSQVMYVWTNVEAAPTTVVDEMRRRGLGQLGVLGCTEIRSAKASGAPSAAEPASSTGVSGSGSPAGASAGSARPIYVQEIFSEGAPCHYPNTFGCIEIDRLWRSKYYLFSSCKMAGAEASWKPVDAQDEFASSYWYNTISFSRADSCKLYCVQKKGSLCVYYTFATPQSNTQPT